MVSRIIFTGDLFRVGPNNKPSSWINITWLRQTFSALVGAATNLPVGEVNWIAGASEFDGALIYKARKLPLTEAGWASLYYAEPTVSELGYFSSFFEDAIVVGFELSHFMCRALQLCGVPYIDVCIHPMRFLDDLPLYFSTPDAGVMERLAPYQMQPDRVIAGRSILAAARRRIGLVRPATARSILLCLQTRADRTLIDGDRFVGWRTFEESLFDLRDKYGRYVIKPHPLEPDHPDLHYLMRVFPGAEVSDENFYRLLSRECTDCVVSLSSSTSSEASALGFQGLHLFRDFYAHQERVINQGLPYIPVYGDFFSVDFWRSVLSPWCATSPISGYSHATQANYLRRLLGSDWGFGDVFS